MNNHLFKTAIFLFVFLFTSLYLIGQITFQRTYGYSMMDFYTSVKQTSDDGFIMTGQSMENYGIDFSGLILKTLPNGDLSWKKTLFGVRINLGFGIYLNDQCSYSANYIQQTSDGGYVVTGQIAPALVSTQVNYRDVFLTKLTSAGVVNWTYHYGGSDSETGNYVKQTSDGGYLIAGVTNSFSAKDSTNIYILKTTSTGAMSWEKTFQLSSVDHDAAVTAEEVSDGFIIGGYTGQINGTDTTADMTLIKLNKTTGALTWINTYGNNADDERIFDIKYSTSTGNLFVTGYTNQPSGYNNLLLMKINPSNGNVVSSVSYFTGFLSVNDEGHTVSNTSDGGIVIMGFSFNMLGGAYSVLMKTDATGDAIILAKGFNNGFMGMQFFSSGQQTSDGGYVIGNMGPGVAAWDFGLIKTDNTGSSGCNETDIEPVKEACAFTPETPIYTNYTGTTATAIDAIINDVTISEDILCCAPLPDNAGTITGTAIVCQGQNGVAFSIPAITNATGYTWTLPSGASIASGTNTNSITVNFSASAVSGTITVYGTNNCGVGGSSTFNITVNAIPAAAGTITGTTPVCQGQNTVTYSVPAITGATTYNWTVPTGATIVSGSGTNTITVDFSASATSGNVSVYASNSCGNGSSSSLPVAVETLPASAGTITGSATVCQGISGESYTIPAISGATGYVWTLPTGTTIASGDNTNSITVDFSGSAISGTISVYGTNACGNGEPFSLNITVNSLPATPVELSGDNEVCQTETGIIYSIPALAGATGYVWTVPSGATITGGQNTNSITVDFSDTAISGNVTVYGTNDCGNGVSVSLPVTVSFLPGAAGIIAGEDTVCQGQSGVIYSVPVIAGADTYIWNLPSGASIASGSGADSIYVDFAANASNGIISVYASNFCGMGDSTSMAVELLLLPADAGTITGTATVCQSSESIVFSVPAIADADYYIWSLPLGASIINGDSTNTITVDFSTQAVSGNVIVYGINNCGNGMSSSYIVTIDPLPQTPGSITGGNQVCQNESDIVYSVSSIPNASGYTWLVPSGANITAGTNTNTITVSFSDTAITGNIAVFGVNSCGNGDTVYFPVTVSALPGKPGAIVGNPVVCQNETGITFAIPPVSGASSYQWSLPAEFNVTGGSGTNAITVDFSSAATTGIISVCGVNSCGSGDTVAYAVTVNPVPVFVLSKSDIKCHGETNGTAWVIVLTSVPPVTFNWSNSSTNDTITNLTQGLYSVTLTDGNNCQSAGTINIIEPAQLSLLITADSVSCFNTNDGSALAVVSGGTSPYEYTWSDNNTTQTPGVTGLSPNLYYHVVVIDDNLCTVTDSVMLFAPAAITAGVTGTTAALCFNGSDGTANLWSTGGTGQHLYNWGGTVGVTDSVASGLSAGTYQVTVSDSNACNTIISVTISQPSMLAVSILADSTSCIDANDGKFYLSTSGGTPPYMYNLSGTPVADSVFISLPGGTYSVTITDSHLCSVVETVIVPTLSNICLEIPSAFTPNGDGKNDKWEIKGILFYPLVSVEIYNRWGQLMFESKGYTTPWDGIYKGTEVPTGSYVYILNLNNGYEPYNGTVTIVR